MPCRVFVRRICSPSSSSRRKSSPAPRGASLRRLASAALLLSIQVGLSNAWAQTDPTPPGATAAAPEKRPEPKPKVPGNLLNSDEKPPSAGGPPPTLHGKTEFTLVPAVGGSTDIGVAIGYFTALTRTQKGYVPYLWNLESAGLMSFGFQNSAATVPYIDVYGKLTVPRFVDQPLALELRPSFTDEQALYYYGMGNASSATPPAGQSMSYFEYGRIHPSLLADVRFKIVDYFAGIAGMRYTGSWYTIPAGSRLAADLQNGSPEVRSLIGPTSQTNVGLFIYGVQLDTRDSEVTPHSGTFDEAQLKLSPGEDGAIPFRYGEASLNLRAYVPIAKKITLAGRIVGDVLFGDPPFSELPRFEDTYAVGGFEGRARRAAGAVLRKGEGLRQRGAAGQALRLPRLLEAVGLRLRDLLRRRPRVGRHQPAPRARRHGPGAQVWRRWGPAAVVRHRVRAPGRRRLVARRDTDWRVPHGGGDVLGPSDPSSSRRRDGTSAP